MLLGSDSDDGQHIIRSTLSAGDYVQRAHTERWHGRGKIPDSLSGRFGQQRQDVSAAADPGPRYSPRGTQLGERGVSRLKSLPLLFFYLDAGGYNAEPPTLGLTLGATTVPSFPMFSIS